METRVKVLRGVTIFCQRGGCERPASHLFRDGSGPIVAFCESHAEGEADRRRIDLPMDATEALLGSW